MDTITVMGMGTAKKRVDFMDMWPFWKRHPLVESGIFHDFTDWHSHLLPGVDDGVRTMDEALDVFALYEKLEVKAVWLTPHIMEDVPNTAEDLKERFGELQATYKGAVHLHLAAEYMLDNLFRQRLNDKDLLPLGERGDRLLVETSYYNPPTNLYGLLEEIKRKGFHPVLAHPERYMYMGKEDYERLKGMDVGFQLNLFSLTGLYGKDAQKKAEWLSRKGHYNMVGTDTHSMEMLQTCLAGKSSTRHSLTLSASIRHTSYKV